VCIYRIPLGLSVVTPRSFCPSCKKAIPWYLNIPLVTFLALRGRCKHCGTKISPRYFLVELLTAVLFLLIWMKFGFQPGPRALGLSPVTHWAVVPTYWLVVSGLILGSFVDIEYLIIPDRVTLGGIAAGLILSVVVPALHGTEGRLTALVYAGVGAALGWGVLWAVAVLGKLVFRKDAMGFGDVKLLGAIGAFMGWRSVLCTIMLSSLAGSMVGLALVAAQRKEMQSKIPYGPYLALAAVVWLLWGPALWQAYISLLGPPVPATAILP